MWLKSDHPQLALPTNIYGLAPQHQNQNKLSSLVDRLVRQDSESYLERLHLEDLLHRHGKAALGMTPLLPPRSMDQRA